VWIPAGSFTMGSKLSAREVAIEYGGEAKYYNNEHPQHLVTLTEGFWLGKYEVAQSEWEGVMGGNPSRFKASKNPVEQVSWKDVARFCEKLGNGLRLPTEAEWEYACRSGSTTEYCFGDSESGLGSYAWYYDNSGYTTHAVGEKKSNAWGLYDMHGNVWEWCQDWYGNYSSSSVSDPQGPSSDSSYRVIRGGSWNGAASDCRSAIRFRDSPDNRYILLGFRVCRSAG